jgi:RsiW-degrading membrane proteinase PrsW (M82 family)
VGVHAFHALIPFDVGSPPADAVSSLLYYVVVVGLLEELCKMSAVLVTCWPRRDFREPWDGLACASTAALGFATVENFSYVLNYGDPSILLGRFLLSTVAHVAMSGIWGFALGLCKQSGSRLPFSLLVWEALLWSAIGHGAYDWFLSMGWMWGGLAVFGGLILIFRQRLQEAHLTSLRRRAPSQRVVECPACRSLYRSNYRYCCHCGQRRDEEKPRMVCLICLADACDDPQCSSCQRPFF